MNTKRCLLRKKQLNLSKNKAKFCPRSRRTIFLRVGIAQKVDDGGFEWLHWTTMASVPNCIRSWICFRSTTQPKSWILIYFAFSFSQLYVTWGYKESGATHSNHKVGHTIDMNTRERPGGSLCTWNCLLNPTGKTKCFIDAIKANSQLRWGGEFSSGADPVHIDDNLWFRNPTLWNQPQSQLRPVCP